MTSLHRAAVALRRGGRTAMQEGPGLLLDAVGVGGWSLIAFWAGSVLVSTEAGGLVAAGVLVSTLAFVVSSRLQEREAMQLASGCCPGCGETVGLEHWHRRWDAVRAAWLPPMTTWECGGCGFGRSEPVACEDCPKAA